MKRFSKKVLIISFICSVIIGAAFFTWYKFASPTRIAFVNYQAITLGEISKVNDNSFVKLSELPIDELKKARNFDMVFVNGMGLRITEEQRNDLRKAAESGTPVITTSVTNPDNEICSIDSIDYEFLKQYLVGGKKNYRNLLKYVRTFIDGKKFFNRIPGDPVSRNTSLIYYPSEKEDLDFSSVKEYESWLRKKSKWSANAPKIILTGQMGVADSLVTQLEKQGNIVYPVNMIQPFISFNHADTVKPSAVINMAHGRLGEMVVEWFKEKNIPLFSPVNANRDFDEWMKDPMGMNGGFLSQSVVTPEIDGAILPYTLFAHFKGKDGLPYIQSIPDRLKDFINTVSNYLKLRTKPNKDKKIAIYYFKGPGQSSLVAEGMDVATSLFNLLTRLKKEGYTVTGLPEDATGLEKIINENGKIFNDYAIGAKADFVKTHKPLLIGKTEYEKWCKKSIPDKLREQIDSVDGIFPGHGLKDEERNVAIARIQFGNVVLIPQTAVGLGDDDFKIIHGTNVAPPHSYVASYLWTRHGFGADALIHFGAHGSLEFTPRKQVALGSEDWPDRLIGTIPHFYIYSTSNVGEAMIAKRRSYAGIINYLTPPFMPSNVREIYKHLTDAINSFNKSTNKNDSVRNASLVRKHTINLGIHRELRIDSTKPLNPHDIARIENFAEELVNEKITGALYVMGIPYSADHIRTTVEAMTIDPIAFSLKKLRGGDIRHWRKEAERMVKSGLSVDDDVICNIAGIRKADLDSARTIMSAMTDSKDLLSKMMVLGSMMSGTSKASLKISERKSPKKHSLIPGMSPEKALALARKMGADDKSLIKMEKAMKRGKSGGGMKNGTHHTPMKTKEFTHEQIEFATAVTEIEKALRNIDIYRKELSLSPEAELTSIVNALNGGFITPTSGGDPVLNPSILPTGRNMFAVNAEETPSSSAWESGVKLANNTIEMYKNSHNGSFPRKISYTLWSGEFIETEGATIAQVLYMLGVEPVRDAFGRVTDLRLIPSKELGRPRIDVVVQTSGQLRDIAASRLFLINRAVRMASEAKDNHFPNYVNEGVTESERYLVEKGVAPKEARKLSYSRVFGGVNGNYGSGIQEMVESGDKWDNSSEIAKTYINNMGAVYGDEENWEQFNNYTFKAALTRTDAVVQPRQSNTWGALSLDHVYEFMGGLNLAVKNVTGKDPDAYLSDYRNRNNTRMQDVKEAIGVESRTTILNPEFIKEKMKGGAGDAAGISDVIKNTYGWNVMKPDVIDNELWNDIYDTYIEDKNNLGITNYFKEINPAAIQEMTAVMLETARKGMWKASNEQIRALADLHTEIVEEFGAACTGFVCDNAKLMDYISKNVSRQKGDVYKKNVADVRSKTMDSNEGIVMKKDELNKAETITNRINGVIVAIVVLIVIIGLIILIRSHRKRKIE